MTASSLSHESKAIQVHLWWRQTNMHLQRTGCQCVLEGSERYSRLLQPQRQRGNLYIQQSEDVKVKAGTGFTGGCHLATSVMWFYHE